MHSWIMTRRLVIVMKIVYRICRRKRWQSRRRMTSLVLLLSMSPNVKTCSVSRDFLYYIILMKLNKNNFFLSLDFKIVINNIKIYVLHMFEPLHKSMFVHIMMTMFAMMSVPIGTFVLAHIS